MFFNQKSVIIEPTLYHNSQTCEDLPVWKITIQNIRIFFCERRLKKGFVPLTITGESSFSHKSGLSVCGVHIPSSSMKILPNQQHLITYRDGFKAPNYWYQKTEEDITVYYINGSPGDFITTLD